MDKNISIPKFMDILGLSEDRNLANRQEKNFPKQQGLGRRIKHSF